MSDKEKPSNVAERAEEALNRSERFLQGLAYAAVVGGVVILLGFAWRLWGDGYWSAGHISLPNSSAVGDFIGGVAGSLFALAGVLLFYLALTLQRKEFRNSLKELRITSQALHATEQHHRDTLQLMREEKEFSVCHIATVGLTQAFKEMTYTSGTPGGPGARFKSTGKKALMKITELWVDEAVALKLGNTPRFAKRERPYTVETVFGRYMEVFLLNRQLFSLFDAVSEKPLGPWEREYLLTLLTPLMMDMYQGVEQNVNVCIATLKEVEATDSPLLAAYGLNKKDIKLWREDLEALKKLRGPAQ